MKVIQCDRCKNTFRATAQSINTISILVNSASKKDFIFFDDLDLCEHCIPLLNTVLKNFVKDYKTQ